MLLTKELLFNKIKLPKRNGDFYSRADKNITCSWNDGYRWNGNICDDVLEMKCPRKIIIMNVKE